MYWQEYLKMCGNLNKDGLFFCPICRKYIGKLRWQHFQQFHRAKSPEQLHKETIQALSRYWHKYHHDYVLLENISNPELVITACGYTHTPTYQRKPKLQRDFKISDYCKYCTDFLMENDEDNCVKCGIRDAIREEECQ